MNQEEEKSMYDVADKFINLANELAQSDPSGSGLVGPALRFAAAVRRLAEGVLALARAVVFRFFDAVDFFLRVTFFFVLAFFLVAFFLTVGITCRTSS